MRSATTRLLACLLTGSCFVLLSCDSEEDTGPPARGEADSATPDTPQSPVTPDLESEDAGADAAGDMQQQAAMNDYVSNLNEAEEILADVDNAVEAAAASPKLAPIVEQLKSFKTTWDEMDPQTREQLASAFRDQLEPVLTQINQHIERIQNDPTFGDQLKSLVGEIPLIEI